jgi:hypothetical protein
LVVPDLDLVADLHRHHLHPNAAPTDPLTAGTILHSTPPGVVAKEFLF